MSDRVNFYHEEEESVTTTSVKQPVQIKTPLVIASPDPTRLPIPTFSFAGIKPQSAKSNYGALRRVTVKNLSASSTLLKRPQGCSAHISTLGIKLPPLDRQPGHSRNTFPRLSQLPTPGASLRGVKLPSLTELGFLKITLPGLPELPYTSSAGTKPPRPRREIDPLEVMIPKFARLSGHVMGWNPSLLRNEVGFSESNQSSSPKGKEKERRMATRRKRIKTRAKEWEGRVSGELFTSRGFGLVRAEDKWGWG